jgi:hypothetical protein
LLWSGGWPRSIGRARLPHPSTPCSPKPAPPVHLPTNPTHRSTTQPPTTGLYPELPIEAGLAVDQVVGGVEDLIVATVPFLFAAEADKARLKATLESDTYPKFFGAFERLLRAHGDGFFYGSQVRFVCLFFWSAKRFVFGWRGIGPVPLPPCGALYPLSAFSPPAPPRRTLSTHPPSTRPHTQPTNQPTNQPKRR